MANTNLRRELTSGQLGAAAGVSADTIRHYERLGLLKKAVRSDGGYRLFDPSAIIRVQTIRSALKAGFSLAELSQIFRERDAGGAPCYRVAALAAQKVESLEEQIRELVELKDWLASTVHIWQERLERIPAGKQAGLLDSLREGHPHTPINHRKELRMKTLVLISALSLAAGARAQTATASPMHDQHQESADPGASVNHRGDHAMGFSHETTAHHFTLLPDGGIIEVDIKAEQDDATRDQIRMHLTHIAAMFSDNNFDVPMFIHDRIPPGVPVMKQRHAAISYTFQPTGRGGQVRIATRDPKALKAIHEFLTFQIQDHRTDDSPEVKTQS